MRLDKVNLNLLVTFDAIYSEASLTRAAELLHVTQPAISNSLRRLRDVYDDPLFVRTPDGMLPTPVASSAIGRVRQALKLIDSSLSERDRFEPKDSDRVFKIAMGDMAEALLLPGVLRQMQISAPRIALRSFTISRKDIPLELASNGIDIAIQPPLINDPGVESLPLAVDRYVCVMREGHPMAKKRLTLKRYLNMSHLHLSSRRRGSGHIDLALRGLGVRRQITMRAQHYLVAPLIIDNTDLVLSIPASLAKRLGLGYRSLPFEVQPFEIHMYWHKNADNDSANAWLRSAFARSIGAAR
jgi:DNA-binding transcriptional LysR family regulator